MYTKCTCSAVSLTLNTRGIDTGITTDFHLKTGTTAQLRLKIYRQQHTQTFV